MAVHFFDPPKNEFIALIRDVEDLSNLMRQFDISHYKVSALLFLSILSGPKGNVCICLPSVMPRFLHLFKLLVKGWEGEVNNVLKEQLLQDTQSSSVNVQKFVENICLS